MSSNRLRVLLMSLLAAFAVGALASASASAAPFWEVCEVGPTTEPPAKFDNHRCNTQVKPLSEREWEWKKLEAGKSYAVKSKGGAQKLILNTSPQIIITCTAVKDKGNIKGGAPGTDEVTELEYTGCTINIVGCAVVKTAGAPNGTIVVPPPLKTELFEEGGVIKDRVSPNAGTLFVTIEIGKKEKNGKAEEKCGVLPVKNEVKGTAVGKVEGENLRFAGEGTLTVSGIESKLEGLDEQELENGWAFRAHK